MADERTQTPGPDERATSAEPIWQSQTIFRVLVGASVVLIAVDVLFPKHGPFALEHWLGFYGGIGFLAIVAFVLAARLLRGLVRQPENVYDDD